MNRVGLGLAVGAGYVLGRTKKMKMAFAVGTLVAGKRMHLSPRALADLVSGQLRNNPQFKEIGDQLREDLRGVGKAASGAMVERRIDALADRLHGRTAQVRDQLAGVVPDASDLGSEDEERAEAEEPEFEEDREDPEGAREYEEPEEEPDEEAPGPGRKTAAKTAPPPAKKAVKKAPAKKAARAAGKTPDGKAPARTPAKKAAGKKTAAKKTAAKKATATKGAARGTRARQPRGGGER